jgi:phosphohistidine phosphatase
MELYILRHGIAAEKGDPRYPKDEDRPLTEEGQKKTLKVARRMKALGLRFDLILSSPLARARQTAEIAGSVLGCKNKLKFSTNLAPEGNKRALLREIGRRPSVLLVGHEPYLSELISTLLSGTAGLRIELRKAGLCKLAANRLRYGRCATLEWLAPAKLLTQG